MLVLGIETSCDDTAAAVVEDGFILRSSVVSSQDSIHSKYGGIVPELASRRHIEAVIPVVEEALSEADVRLEDLQGIGVTQGPGLVGSILVGLSFAKALSFAKKIPFVGVNHIVSHPLAVFLRRPGEDKKDIPAFPFVALVVSGGHTTLLLIKSFTDYDVLGRTRDDAAGEAFDKVAKLLGLGYPGGAVIDRLAKEGNPGAVEFTRPYIAKGNLDFSFSGIKTAVLNHLKRASTGLSEGEIKDLAASFQEAVVDVLAAKALWALERTGAKDLVVAGGVACNSRLREKLSGEAEERGIRVFLPPPSLCTDNGAMVAAGAYHLLKRGDRSSLSLNAVPGLEGL